MLQRIVPTALGGDAYFDRIELPQTLEEFGQAGSGILMGLQYSYKDIQLPQLRSFCLAATSHSFTAAAKVLGLSVSAVWQQVRALERELNATLLRRHAGTVQITDEGRLLLELVQPHVTGLDSLARLFESRRAEIPQKLTVVSTHGLIAYRLPAPVHEFTSQYPAAQLRLRADIRPAIATEMLEQGEADLAVLAYDPDEPRSPYLQYDDLLQMRLFLLAARAHPLARKKTIRLAEVVRYPLVMEPEGSLPRKVLEKLLRRENLLERMHVVAESATLDILRRYVALGVGVSFNFLDDVILASLKDLYLRQFEPPESVHVAMVVRKGAHLPQAGQDFIRILRQHVPPSRGRRTRGSN